MDSIIDLSRVRRGDVVRVEGRVSGQGVMGGAEPRVTLTLRGGGEYVAPAAAVVAHDELLEVGAHVRWKHFDGEIIAIRGEWGVVCLSEEGQPVSLPLRELRGID